MATFLVHEKQQLRHLSPDVLAKLTPDQIETIQANIRAGNLHAVRRFAIK